MNKGESISMEGGEGNQKNKQLLYVMIALVGLVVLLSVVQTFQVRALKAEMNAITGAAVSSATGALDMSSWTEDEKMMYEHHGTIPARFQSASSSKTSSSSAGAMVGGC